MNSEPGQAPQQKPTQKPTWMHGAAMMTLWLPVLAFVCLSINARIQGKYLDGLLVASQISGKPSLSDILFLYRQDLLIFGVIVPLLTAWAFIKLRFAVAATLSAVLVLLMQILLYANLQSWGQVGSFLTWQAMSNAISFGLTNTEFVGEYLALDGMLKLGALIAMSAAVLIVGRLIWQRAGLIRLWGAAGLLSVAGFAGLAGVGYASGMRSAPITDSFVGNALEALGDADAGAATALPPASELGARYAQLSRISPTPFEGPNFGVHKGSNLLLFVMETASIEFLDGRKGLPAHPVLEALKAKTYVAANHYSTFPASAEGNLSLMTGVYPPRAIYGTCLIDVPREGGRLPGPIGALRDAGYKTGLYAPFRSQVPADKVIFEGMGFEKVSYGELLPETGGPKLPGSGVADLRTLDLLTKDIAGWAKAKQPFAAAFFPQVGHGPWSSELGGSIQERGAKVARQQLDWLGRIVEVLRETGQLDNTVIVVTGDHGVRTSVEDPRVKVGMIDWYSFHVPLLVYAPRADYSALDPSVPSSHVDVSAELGQLFGMASPPSYQGIAFQNPERLGRRGFLMAGWYFGANGYRDAADTAMYSDLLDAVYARSDGKVDFGTGQLVSDERRRAAIRGELSSLAALQEAWIIERVCPKAPAAEIGPRP